MSNICTLLVSGIRPESKLSLLVWVTVRCRHAGIPVFIEDAEYIPPCVAARDVPTSLVIDFADTSDFNNCEWLLDPTWQREFHTDAAWQTRWEAITALIQAMQPHGYTLQLYMGYDGTLPDDFEHINLSAAHLPAFMADLAVQQHVMFPPICLTLLPLSEPET